MSSPVSHNGANPQSPSSSLKDSKHTCFASEVSTDPTLLPLPSSPVSSPRSSNASLDHDSEFSGIEKSLNDLARYLGTSVLLSTFIATIAIAFLTLAHNIIQNRASTEFQVAMLLCFLTVTCHLSIVLVAGRACILAYRYSRLPVADRPTIEEYQKQLEAFGRCLKVSEWVQGFGQALFGPAMLYTIWQMFEDRIYAILVYGFVTILQIIVYGAGFWRVSWAGTMVTPIRKLPRKCSVLSLHRETGEKAV